jgi:hypothetical protein
MISWKKLKPILQKAVEINSKPTLQSFPELVDVLLWVRFLLGTLYGLYLGTNAVKSATLPLQALNLIAFLPVMYSQLYLGANNDSYGMKLVMSGTLNSLALCMLIWIYFYTDGNEQDGARMAALLVSGSNAFAANATDGSILDDGATATDTLFGGDEPEF